MGEFVTDLDDSYTTEDYMDVTLPPPMRLPTLQSHRPTVSLPLRAHVSSSADQPTEGNTQPTPSFGFPVSARCANTPPTPSSEQRRARGHSMRKGSEKLKSLPDRPKRRPRPVTTTPSQEVFHSITATPGLDDRSFEVRLSLPCCSLSRSSAIHRSFALSATPCRLPSLALSLGQFHPLARRMRETDVPGKRSKCSILCSLLS